MKLPEFLLQIKHPFVISLPGGKSLDRFVHSFYADLETALLIDTGTKGGDRVIARELSRRGKRLRDVQVLLLSHSHPDHFGSAPSIQKESNCLTGIHRKERSWVESPELQFAERPVPGFQQLIEGAVQVDFCSDEELPLSLSEQLEVRNAPGHSAGHQHILFPEWDVLFTGDSLIEPGDIPAYDCYAQLKRTLEKLAQEPFEILLSSWREPLTRAESLVEIEKSLEYLDRIDRSVRRVYTGDEDRLSCCREVISRLGLPEFMANPVVDRAFRSHRE